MGCEDGRFKTSSPLGIFIVTPSLEGWSTTAKETTSPNEVRLAPLDTNPVFQSLGGFQSFQEKKPEIFPRGTFLLRVANDCLSRFPYSKKTPLN